MDADHSTGTSVVPPIEGEAAQSMVGEAPVSVTPAGDLSAGAAAPSKRKGLLAALGSQQSILILVLLAMIGGFSIVKPVFFSVGVFGNILVAWAPVALIAIGETFVIISGGIDLSVGSTITLSGVIAGYAMAATTSAGWPSGFSIFIGALVAAGTGLLVGLVNATLINVAKLVPFVATLATLGAGAGVALVLTHGAPVGGGPSNAISLSVPRFGPFSWPAIFVIVVIVIAGFFLHTARFGRYVFAIGGNSFAATAVGISVPRYVTKVYGLSGMFAGLAGMITYLTLASGSPTAGTGDELSAIAAVVIGGASLTGGVGRIGGTVLGSLILTTVTSGLVVVNIDPNWNQVVVAILIAAAVSLQTVRRGIHRRPR
ncbi:MAG: hypothetical protein JWM85_667 [Acidimicrobiaceae bacterium]|nr:hypothetical protein [Acidimicrobiaceae bacterium]